MFIYMYFKISGYFSPNLPFYAYLWTVPTVHQTLSIEFTFCQCIRHFHISKALYLPLSLPQMLFTRWLKHSKI